MKEIFIDNFLALFEKETTRIKTHLQGLELGETVCLVDEDRPAWSAIAKLIDKDPGEPEICDNGQIITTFEVEVTTFLF